MKIIAFILTFLAFYGLTCLIKVVITFVKNFLYAKKLKKDLEKSLEELKQ